MDHLAQIFIWLVSERRQPTNDETLELAKIMAGVNTYRPDSNQEKTSIFELQAFKLSH